MVDSPLNDRYLQLAKLKLIMDRKKVKETYRVPDGYFSDLRTRLYAISEEAGQAQRSFMATIAPYAALAACFVVMFIAGNAILYRTVNEYATDPETEYYAALLSSHSDYFYGEYDDMEEEVSEDDIIDYFIETGTDIEELIEGQ